MLGTTPVLCGGTYQVGGWIYIDECLLYGTTQVITMNDGRTSPSAVAINPNKIWILGGYNGDDRLDSSEFITLDGAENGPTLPEGLNSACAVKLPTEDIYLVGGFTNSFYTNNVWVTNPSNGYTFSQGPSLITARRGHSCSTMSIGAKTIIVVAGGVAREGNSDFFLSSVEILDPLSNQWVAGK